MCYKYCCLEIKNKKEFGTWFPKKCNTPLSLLILPSFYIFFFCIILNTHLPPEIIIFMLTYVTCICFYIFM